MTREIDRGLVETIRCSDLKGVLIDLAETSLDQILEEGPLRELPIIGSVIAMARTGVAVRDRLFLQKVLRFLSPIAEFSPEERVQFLNGLDPAEFRRATESLVLYLDRLDSVDKAQWLGSIFKAYMVGSITYHQMLYFVHFVDRVFIIVWEAYFRAVEHLSRHPNVLPRIALDDVRALAVVGFYEERTKPRHRVYPKTMQITLEDLEVQFVLSDAGWRFIQVAWGLFADGNNSVARARLSVSVPASR